MDDKVLKILEFDKITQAVEELCSCELSKRYARELEPTDDVDEITRLLTETEDAVNCVLKRGSAPGSGVRDLGGVFRRAETEAVLNNADLLGVSSLLTSVRRMITYGALSDNTDAQQLSTTEAMIDRLVPLKHLEQEIIRCILSEEEIADDASPGLSEVRRKIFQLQNSIKDKLNELTHSSKYSKVLQDAIVTVRGDRYCVPVKIENRADVPGIVHDTSASGQTLFVEPAFVVESNNKIRELKVQEQEEIQRILKDLSEQVAENSGVLREDLSLISYLDFTFAKAAYALSLNAVKPGINTDGRIDLKKARHPLLDRRKAVPITVRLGIEDAETGIPARAMIITGPNTGGKTVTLKTVGLLHLMAQSGLLIPAAENSLICAFNAVFADIGDEQSIAQNLSTFSAHMRNITGILREADAQSLVLFDELGAGTDPTEGAALAMSILENVYGRGADVIATTHYSELKVFASTTPGFINACCEFDVETLAPTYRLLIGVPGKSNAFAISEKLGLASEVVARAKEFITAEDLRFEDMLRGIEKNRAETEAAMEESARLKREAQQLADEAREQRDALIRESAELKYRASVRAREADNKARIAAEKMLTDIRRAALLGGSDAVKAAEAAKREFEKTAAELEADIAAYGPAPETVDSGTLDIKTLKAGDSVRLISLNCDATVLAPAKPDGTVYVQAGVVKLYAKADDIAPGRSESEKRAANAQKNRNARPSGDRIVTTAANVRSELDVRGMTVEEATELIERLINDSLLSGQESFRIIHGKGTGALRRGVQNFLRGHKHVKDFRDGSFGEGDLGVTVAKVKH